MAQAVVSGKDAQVVAGEFGVSVALVRKACREFDAEADATNQVAKDHVSTRQVVETLRTGKTPRETATEHHVPVSHVVHVQERVASGLPSDRD